MKASTTPSLVNSFCGCTGRGRQINKADIVHAPDACTCFVLPGPASDRGHLARDGRRRLF